MLANKIKGSNCKKIEEFSSSSCRICLTETDCQNIFELDYEGQDIVEIFNYCTRIELHRKFKDPDYVCISCVTELIQAYEFIRKCQTSHKYLLTIEKTTEKEYDNNSSKSEEIFIEVSEEKATENDKNDKENVEKKDEDDPKIEAKEIKVNSYKCLICSRKYATPNGLRKHSRTHKNTQEISLKHGEEDLEKRINNVINLKEVEIKPLNSHQCTVCLRDFSTSAGLKNHSRIIHENTEETTSKNNNKNISKKGDEENSYKCPVCPKEFTTPAGFKNHLNAHEKAEARKNEKESEERKILDTEIKELKNCRKCPKCEKVFPTAGGLKIHYRSHANLAIAFTCKVCNRNFSSKKNRGQHMLTHSLEKPYRCKECDRGFRQQQALDTHMLIHTGERPVVCEFCAQTFKQVKDLKYHHKQGDCRTITLPKNHPRSCSICLIPMKSYRALRQHHSIVHKKKNFTCKQCGKGFISTWTLKQHLRTHTSNRPHVCSICDKRFLQKSGLQRHIFLHTGERPHKCEICKKSFVQAHHLLTHMRMHRGEKPYTCQICLKGFTSKFNRTVHVRTHTGETPYMCDMCGRRFHDSSLLKKHKHKHALEKIEKPVQIKDESID